MPDQALVAIATVIAALFTLAGVFYTQRTARAIAATTVEEGAYNRARGHHEATIERQDAEIVDLTREVTGLRQEQRDDRAELRQLRRKVEQQDAEIAELKHERVKDQARYEAERAQHQATRKVLTRTEENLAAAEELLRRHYPDEPGDGHAEPDHTGGTP